MCGIAGLVGRYAGSQRAGSMADALSHRGPDGRGVWAHPSLPVALGHRRLAIRDLSPAGAQPMIRRAGDLALVYNGELYNADVLARELAQAGYGFEGHSDTEVLLAAYAHWGEGCLARLAGMFAFAVVDGRRQQVLLARDRCGQKPLYYSRPAEGGMAFASEIKALHAGEVASRYIDDGALQEFLAYGYSLGPQTLTAGVAKVMPGEAIVYDIARATVRREVFWSLPELARTPVTPADAEAGLERRLEDAVARHLVSDVGVGILLSGGIDSSLVTAMAARLRPDIQTFAVTFPGQGQADEAVYARQVADHFGTRHRELEMEGVSAPIFEELVRQFDEPIADHAILPSYLLARRLRADVTVALGGDGGDELFGGYPHYGLVAQQARLRRLPSGLRSGVSGAAQRFLPPGSRGRNHLIGTAGSLGNALAHVNLYFDVRQRAQLLNMPVENSPEARKAGLTASSASPVRRGLETDFQTTLPEGYLAKVDRASMRASLEVRAPLLDNDVVDFAFRDVGDNVKHNHRQDKILLRRLADRLLPTGVARKPKQGLTIPLGTWLQSGRSEFIREVLLDTGQDLFAAPPIERLFALQARGYNNSGRLFALAMVSLWAKEYGMTRS